jgi:hypothetical protein
MTDYRNMTEAQLTKAMDELDAKVAQPEGGLKVRIWGAVSPGTPHHEYFRRSVMNARFPVSG